MQATRVLLRQPMIRFLGKRTIPTQLDHSAKPHPEAPSAELPESFANYREKATQHGPLKSTSPSASQARAASTSSSSSASSAASATSAEIHGAIGSKSAKALGPIKPSAGEFWDRSELPARFHRAPFTLAEIEAIETGGASMF